MTAAVTAPAARAVPGGIQRVLRAVRVQSLQWPRQFWLPAGIFAAIMLFSVAAAVLGDGGPVDGAEYFGVPLPVLACCALGIVHLQTVLQVFPFALGIGITRRTFCLATALVAVVQGVALGALFGLLAQVEVATGGWGTGSRLFGLDQLPPFVSAVAYALMFLVSASVGVLTAAVHKRWGPAAVWVVTLGGGAVIGAVVGLAIGLGRWTAVLTGGPTAVLLVVGLLLSGALGLAGFAVLRRTVP
jgi:hypothetical protein